MNKNDFIDNCTTRFDTLSRRKVEQCVEVILETIVQSIKNDIHVEIRGFGSFHLRIRPARVGRNPKSGEPVYVEEKRTVHFKPGKELKERVNGGEYTKYKY